MRLSEWRASAPHRDAVSAKVIAVVEGALRPFAADPDPACWVAWGDDPSIRYSLLMPIPAGLVTCHVRVNVPGEGPRASAKLTRWPRVQLGELTVDTQGQRVLGGFQLEGTVLRGADDQAGQVASFALDVFAAIDGRPLPSLSAPPKGRRTAATRAATGRRATGPSGESRAQPARRALPAPKGSSR